MPNAIKSVLNRLFHPLTNLVWILLNSALDGRWRRSRKLRVAQVACGYAHTVLLADGDSDVVKRLPAWTPAPAKEAEAGPSGEKGGPPKKKAEK